MFCRKCGKEIPEGMTVCEQCAALEGAAEPAAPAEPVAPVAPAPKAPKFRFPKLSKKMIKIGVAVLAAIAVLAAAVIVLFAIPKKLDLTKFIELKGVEGYDGLATAVVEIDFSGLAEELKFEKTKDIKKLEKLIKSGDVATPLTKNDIKAIEDKYDLKLKELRNLYDAMDIEIEGNGTFKNGDTVKVVISADEDADLEKKLVGGELTCEVKGLKELEKLSLGDVFDVHFSGMNGEGSANLDRKEYDSWKSAVGCSIDKDQSLSNGDKITLTLTISDYYYESYYEQLLEEGYYLPKTEEKTVTVSGLKSYLTKDKITAEVINEAITKTRAYFGPNNEWQLGKVYFLKVKEAEKDSRVDNYIVVTFSQEGNYWTMNRAIALQSNTVDEEGNVSLTANPYYFRSGTDCTEAEMLERIRDGYGDYYTIDTLK